ncbi:putative protein N(5)-glutamine methyltransferase [Streptomyces sp. 549]|uniref:putative protein N(5)-glutamine methyltransferase n=1 Tax=Streptomyces sp. 549 TaxID=3049076 RepID=UPI0024C221F0|nr:putative protein N(5)-glutamine methyltransferase [Streptomyces sp. 549]MDK1476723.1 putative protein N(5)-glutamine methyltransferase [Streptomyces sp. 549]
MPVPPLDLPSAALLSPALVDRLRAAGCVFAEEEAHLLACTARTPAQLAVMVDRRVSGLPLEQVLGWARFHGLRVVLEPGVFVPRRRTEFLVRQAAALARSASAGSASAGSSSAGPRTVVVDLCCGSGAVAAALAVELPGTECHAVDIDPVAVRCARRNLPAGGRAYLGDLYTPLPPRLLGRVDVLVANAPYVPTGSLGLLPPEAREHEPRVALDGGEDGLAVQRRVAAGASRWLAPGGVLLVETSERQAAGTAEAVARGGLTATSTTCEELDATVVVGRLPAA